MNVLHLTHHELSMMIKTMKSQSRHDECRKAKGGRNIKSVTDTFAHNYFVSCEFIAT